MSKATITLTEAQKRTTLTAKKKKQSKKKNVIRNLLLPPYEPFWPVVDPADDCRIRDVLQDVLPALKKKPAFGEGIGVLKKSRKEKISSNCSDSESQKRKDMRSLIFIGVNAVSRAAEKHETCGVLLASDVDPLFLSQHLATLCATHGVPVLVAPSLREVTRTHLGFSCIALGLRSAVEENHNHFNKLHLLIQELSEAYELPLHLQQLRELQKKITMQVDNPEDSSKIISSSSPLLGKEVQTLRPSSDMYIYRTSAKTREFVPQAEEPAKIEPNNTHDFLAVGCSSSEGSREKLPLGISHVLVNKKLNKSAVPYVPFRIKSVKPKSKKRKMTNKIL